MAATSSVDRWLADLTLAEKCQLIGGASSWRTHAIERLGIPALKMSDGPNGVRGEHAAGDRNPAVVVPVGIAQGASWDPDLIGRIGDLLGREARRRAVHVLLGPAINLHRTPVGGRTFEYFSEDPELTAAMAVATVTGIQAHGVATTAKHFVANDTEVDRHTVDVAVDERTLRELYLRPFEAAVTEAGAWGVMSAYNRVGGHFCAAHDRLLNQVLRGEWGFDGFVVSDWFGAHDPVGSANGGLSIEMPGPSRIYGERLEAAVAEGVVDEGTVDDLVRDVLVLIERTKAMDRSADEPERSVDDAAERALCRQAAVAGMVLAKNAGDALPLAAPRPGASVAVLGPNAAASRIMGGGSSALRPLAHRSILDAFVDRVPVVVHEPGCQIDRHTPLPPPEQLVGPDGEPGLVLDIINGSDPDATPVHSTRLDTSTVRFFGSVPAGVDTNDCIVAVRGAYIPAVDGPHEVGAVVTGHPTVTVGGAAVIAPGQTLERGDAFYGFGSAEQLATIEMRAGEPVPIDIALGMRNPFGGMQLGIREPRDDDAVMARAVEAARDAEAAVVVVGTTDEWETEGHDRDRMALPGDQDELVRRVAAVNDRTIVVVNAGAPVLMPWAGDVAAIVVPFFGGIEMADAVVDVVLGEADPGGRFPITFPAVLEDSPAWPHYAPVDGVQTYGEGLDMGYRGHDRSGVAPLFPFGHGLSYGPSEWGPVTASATDVRAAALHGGRSVTITVPVTATGSRDATVVVQGYVAPVDPPVHREVKALRCWSKVVVPAGTTDEVRLDFPAAAFRRWDVERGDWVIDPGAYDVVVARSVTDVHASHRIQVT